MITVKRTMFYVSGVYENDSVKVELFAIDKDNPEKLANKAYELFKIGMDEICINGTSTQIFKDKLIEYLFDDIKDKFGLE